MEVTQSVLEPTMIISHILLFPTTPLPLSPTITRHLSLTGQIQLATKRNMRVRGMIMFLR